MEIRLQPGQGNNAPRIALFALLAALSILILGVYWFYQPDSLVARKPSAAKIPPGKRPIGYFAYRTDVPAMPHPAEKKLAAVPSKEPVPARKIATIPPAAPVKAQTPLSKTLIEAMSQDDPDDPQEQGDDIAVLKDEKAANPQAVAPALALSRRLMQAGRYPEAEQELRGVLQQVPTNLGARHQLGSALAAQGHKEEAIQEWRAVAETGDPTWKSIAEGAITRAAHPEQPAVAVPDGPRPDLRPALPIVSIE